MKWIKLFENFEESEFESILYGSDAKLTLEVDSRLFIDDIDLIIKMAADYKRTYIKNNEWGGGPVNREWKARWEKYFPGKKLHGKIYKPSLVLDIDLKEFGRIRCGFSLVSGKLASYGNYLNSDSFDSKKEYSNFVSFLRNIFGSRIKFDTFEDKYNINIINLKGKEMNIEYVKENDETNNLLKSLRDLSKEFNRLSNAHRQYDEHEQRRKILNTDDKIIKNVKNLGEIDPYWHKQFYSDEALSNFYKDLFSYFTDENWSLDIKPTQFYIQIQLRKSFKDNIDAEALFNDVNKKASSINKAIELEGHQTLYQITFNGKHQSENNPITHKNDIYKYKGFDKITEPRWSSDKGMNRLLAIVKFTII
jgi:hypothetical protein